MIDPRGPRIVLPADLPVPAAGMNIRWPDAPLDQELRLQRDKIYAALAYCRANGLNRITIDSPSPRLGIIASGKSYLDVLQALEDLGIDERHAAEIGIRLFKVGMPWPLEPNGVREFAQGLDEILVVEEKRQLIEYQMKEQLYNWRDDVRPRVIGKYDEHGEWEAAPRRVAAAGRGRAHAGDDRARHRGAHRQVLHLEDRRGAAQVPRGQGGRARAARGRRPRASRTSARAARTTPPPACPRARRRSRASAATTWPPGSGPSRR